MLRLAELPFAVEPEEELSGDERRLLAPLRGELSPGTAPVFRLSLARTPPWEPGPGEELPVEGPALLTCDGDRVLMGKASFRALLEPLAGRGTLWREAGADFALLVTLKAALSSTLPLVGGVALHSAALVRGDRAMLFCGPSGAGKSTLSGLSPFPVLSDELVAVVEEPAGFVVRASGFWGTLDRDDTPRGSYALGGLFELAKASRVLVEPLDSGTAFRRLLGVALMPPVPGLWAPALRTLARLSSATPSFRLAWNPAAPPWRELEEVWERERAVVSAAGRVP